MKASLLNGLTLAYLGDAAYELVIRQHLIEVGWTKPNDLHHHATHYVSAKAQADILASWLAEGCLEEEELQLAKRARNAKSYTKAKHTDPATYQSSTAFEALLGGLYIEGQADRFDQLCQQAIKHVENKDKGGHHHG